MKATLTLAAINERLEEAQEREHRNHLGASVIGKKCSREIWYGFRWSAKELFEGRMLRLFERGQLEENRFLGYLESIGCEVWPVDPKTGEQWRISDCGGHFGGSTDGVARGIPDLPPGTPFLSEFKTHNDKSFKAIVKEGLCQAKGEHFAQTQSYMYKMSLPWGLYCAVNKNDDDLHLELVQANPGFAATLIEKARYIINADVPPPRINSSPGFYLCRFCYFKDICHDKVAPEKNCRTCYFSQPVDGGQWRCNRYNCTLTREQQASGCLTYTLHPEFCK